MYALISQLTLVCNMQLNVLEDLAEAMKALDEKNVFVWFLLGVPAPFCVVSLFFCWRSANLAG